MALVLANTNDLRDSMVDAIARFEVEIDLALMEESEVDELKEWCKEHSIEEIYDVELGILNVEQL